MKFKKIKAWILHIVIMRLLILIICFAMLLIMVFEVPLIVMLFLNTL